MNTYKVNLMDAATGNGLGAIRIQAADKETAAVEAIKAKVRFAKAYNAKYDNEGLPEWARESENHADYKAWGIRKVPTRQNA